MTSGLTSPEDGFSGWKTDDLQALDKPYLINKLVPPLPGTSYNGGTDKTPFITNPYNFLLSSIWMSGYGVAADDDGSLYFITGNSAKYVSTYGPPNNIQNSVVKLSGDLSGILSFFSPSDAAPHGVKDMDFGDLDFGSGGVLLLPDQSLPVTRLAAAMGKAGILYLLDRDNLGGHGVNLQDKVVFEHSFGAIDACYCGSSYFEGPDGVGRVVTSALKNVVVWKLQAAGGGVTLVQESASSDLPKPQKDGFFTSISSNGNRDAIIWAVSRPMSSGASRNQFARV